MLAGQFSLANRAIFNHIIATLVGASGFEAVLLYCICCRMTRYGNHFGFEIIATRAIALVFACCFTRRCDCLIPFAKIMTKSVDFVMLAGQFSLANRAICNHIIAAIFCASRFDAVFFDCVCRGVTICGDHFGFVVVAT